MASGQHVMGSCQSEKPSSALYPDHEIRGGLESSVATRRRNLARLLLVPAVLMLLVWGGASLWHNAPVLLRSDVSHGSGPPQAGELGSLSHGENVEELAGDDDIWSPSLKRQVTASASVAPRPTVLENFQVAQPVLMPYGAADSDGSNNVGVNNGYTPKSSCTVTLMNYAFGNSYGKPYVGESASRLQGRTRG